MSLREELAEVLVASAISNEDRQHGAVFHCEFCADDWAEILFFSGGEETWRAVNSITIAKCQCGHLQFSSNFGQLLRQRTAAQKAEGATAVEFDVHNQLLGSEWHCL